MCMRVYSRDLESTKLFFNRPAGLHGQTACGTAADPGDLRDAHENGCLVAKQESISRKNFVWLYIGNMLGH